MTGIIVAAHSDLAAALVRTARLVVDNEVPLEAVAIEATDSSATYEPRLHTAINRANDGDGVLVLTDMFGGTPSNVGMTMHHPGRVELLTGVNLPMLIKALQLSARGVELSDIAHQVRVAGQRSITVATEILSGVLATEIPSGRGDDVP